MPARPNVASQHALTKTIPSQRGQKMHLNVCWANDDTSCISIYVDHTVPCQHGQNFDRNICWQKPSHSCEDTKCMSPRFNKPIPWKREQKMYLNMRWPNPCPTTEHTKCILTCVDQTQPISAKHKILSTSVHRTPVLPASKRNVYQLLLTKPNRCQREVLTKPNTYASLHALSLLLHCQRTHKMHINLSWQRPIHGSEHIKCNPTLVGQPLNDIKASKCISTCIDESLPLPARKRNASQHVFPRPIP